jgi:hypothetical protein
MNERDFENGCFSGDWCEFEVQQCMTKQERKDLATLLIELEDIKQDFKRISEHKDRLCNLMKFYNGGITAEH